MTSPTLERLYASGGTEVILYTLELTCPAWADSILLCQGFEDITATAEDGRTLTFTASGIDIALPKKDTSGNQTLTFAIDGVNGDAQQHIDSAIEAFAAITLVMRTYISTDLSTPAENPFRATVLDFTCSSTTVQLNAGFFDLINLSWPRRLYTKEFVPGLTYSGG